MMLRTTYTVIMLRTTYGDDDMNHGDDATTYGGDTTNHVLGHDLRQSDELQ